MRFQHGYYIEEGYTYGACLDQFPRRLWLLALLRGHRSFSLDQPFRLLELGCGQGVGLALQAALHPHAQFHGLDLLEEHVQHAEALAGAAGLGNVRFEQADLIRLAATGPASGHVADIVVSHGVHSWVNAQVQQALWQLAVQSLVPGGLFAVSYNCFPGWLTDVPFQHLVQAMQRRQPDGRGSLSAAIALFQRLRTSGAALFAEMASLGERIDGFADQDPHYLCHEYNQQHWQPCFSDRVIAQAEELGLLYLGSAYLAENCDAILPESFQALLREPRDSALRELLRDLLVNQGFRQDVYCLGLDPLWQQQAEARWLELPLIRLVDGDQLEHLDLTTFLVSFGSVSRDPRWSATFLSCMGEEPCRLADVLARFGEGGDLPLPELALNLSLLLGRGLVAVLAPPVDPAPAQRLNRILTDRVRSGIPYTTLAIPAIADGMVLSELQMLALDAWFRGERGPALVEALQAAVLDRRRGDGRGHQLPQSEDERTLLRRTALQVEQRLLPRLQRLGAVA